MTTQTIRSIIARPSVLLAALLLGFFLEATTMFSKAGDYDVAGGTNKAAPDWATSGNNYLRQSPAAVAVGRAPTDYGL